jgi:hypothetical protein
MRDRNADAKLLLAVGVAVLLQILTDSLVSQPRFGSVPCSQCRTTDARFVCLGELHKVRGDSVHSLVANELDLVRVASSPSQHEKRPVQDKHTI